MKVLPPDGQYFLLTEVQLFKSLKTLVGFEVSEERTKLEQIDIAVWNINQKRVLEEG